MTVFVSVPGVLAAHQQKVFSGWMDRLDRSGLRLDVLPRQTGTADTQHLSAVRAAIRRSQGVLVLGFRQLRVDAGVWRPATEEQKSGHGWWSTPWVQIEAGMAIMLEKPTLVLREPGVVEGIFDRRNWTDCVVGAELSSETTPPALTDWLLAINELRVVVA